MGRPWCYWIAHCVIVQWQRRQQVAEVKLKQGEERSEEGAAQQKRGAFMRAGREGWRGGAEEQTGLCSPCTHGYCMAKSAVEHAVER